VNEFIDLILTEWATPQEKKHFLNGLAGIDKQSNDLTERSLSTPVQHSRKRCSVDR